MWGTINRGINTIPNLYKKWSFLIQSFWKGNALYQRIKKLTKYAWQPQVKQFCNTRSEKKYHKPKHQHYPHSINLRPLNNLPLSCLCNSYKLDIYEIWTCPEAIHLTTGKKIESFKLECLNRFPIKMHWRFWNRTMFSWRISKCLAHFLHIFANYYYFYILHAFL